VRRPRASVKFLGFPATTPPVHLFHPLFRATRTGSRITSDTRIRHQRCPVITSHHIIACHLITTARSSMAKKSAAPPAAATTRRPGSSRRAASRSVSVEPQAKRAPGRPKKEPAAEDSTRESRRNVVLAGEDQGSCRLFLVNFPSGRQIQI
jgi:hypothetical protein